MSFVMPPVMQNSLTTTTVTHFLVVSNSLGHLTSQPRRSTGKWQYTVSQMASNLKGYYAMMREFTIQRLVGCDFPDVFLFWAEFFKLPIQDVLLWSSSTGISVIRRNTKFLKLGQSFVYKCSIKYGLKFKKIRLFPNILAKTRFNFFLLLFESFCKISNSLFFSSTKCSCQI